jgi:type II secretory pathway component GspD/PulD (secretin)
VSATLGALINQSKAKILAAPKVVTINGQPARIEAVQDIRFRTSTVSNGVVSSDFKTVSAGIILAVTPTINAEDRITLQIKPESSFPTQQSTDAGPIIRTRTAQTTVSIRDGETLVIGGLIDDQDTKGVTKVPVLGDIPIIGVFFRSNFTRKVRNELLVFVTPRIIKD